MTCPQPASDVRQPALHACCAVGVQVMVQPEAVRFPRKPLQLNFAVLLMRSSYDAVDALDFIPMERFEVSSARRQGPQARAHQSSPIGALGRPPKQANFWKLRQSELDPYNNQYAPLKFRAGDLTDPLCKCHRACTYRWS